MPHSVSSLLASPETGITGQEPARSIPAWAGKPVEWRGRAGGLQVHPRVGGETAADVRERSVAEGPSPRGRGNPPGDVCCHGADGSIPAWAGKPGGRPSTVCRAAVHPRVGGETGAIRDLIGVLRGPSPRGRGNRYPEPPVIVKEGSIPAWAGKPHGREPPDDRAWVHPRVGGETSAPGAFVAPFHGPSPRGRGNRWTTTAMKSWRWSIPAWAGKPVGLPTALPL